MTRVEGENTRLRHYCLARYLGPIASKELVLLEISRYVKAFYSTVRTLFEILDSSSNS